MALTLGAELSAAQDLQTRRPLIEIISSQREADIPFDGTLLTAESFNEYGANVIPHSSGRLCAAYLYGPDADDDCGIKYIYTDTERTEVTTVTIELFDSDRYYMTGVHLCELTGGNIGLVYIYVDTSGTDQNYLASRILTVEGALVTSSIKAIGNWNLSVFTSDPWVKTLGADSYMMIYGKQNSSNYYIYKRTSSDFLTWSAESAISIGGITTTFKLQNPSIVEINTGDLWLLFDALEATSAGGEELRNVYYSISADSGATWGNAVKLTSYDTYSAIGTHPIAVQRIAATMDVVYTQIVGALHMDESASGWPDGESTYELSFDSVNRMLYAINITYGATPRLQCIVKIDVDTWTVDDYWDDTTTPGFPSWMSDGGTEGIGRRNTIHDGHHIAVFCYEQGVRSVWYLNGEENTIKEYHFDTSAPLSITANVTCDLDADDFESLEKCFVDAANNRIWLLLIDPYLTRHALAIGYLDLTETENFTFTVVVNDSSFGGSNTDQSAKVSGTGHADRGGMYIDVAGGYIVVCGCQVSRAVNITCIYDIEDGGRIAKYDESTPDHPIYGLTRPTVYNGKIYGGLRLYTTGSSQESFRGLVEIDIQSGTIATLRPSYCSDDEHVFGLPIHLEDGRLAMMHGTYGISVFDTVSRVWQLFNNDNVPGLTMPGLGDPFATATQIAYDPVNDLLMFGDIRDNATYSFGVGMFSVNGYIRQSYYIQGADPGGGWDWEEAEQLVQGFLDYDAGVCKEPDETSMYAFWTSEKTDGERSIKWDKDGSSVNITKYLINGREVVTAQAIDGNPASLFFTVSHGHLFDPYNRASLLAPIMKKGRKLALRWGETVSGTDYWQNAGQYYITGTQTSLKRGQYPEMQVTAEDQRTLWRFNHIVASEQYNNTPKEILDDILQEFANIAAGDLNIPVFIGTTDIDHQWIDTDLEEIINQICNRFGYYFRFDCDGKAHARFISNVAAVDHTYTDTTKIINFSQDDRYSDFTNQVVVQGQERDFTQVVYPEERIKVVAGTFGWWGGEEKHTVFFSEDKSRRAINPRMRKVKTATSVAFALAGSVQEKLTECGPADDNKFCTVSVKAPNLIVELLTFIGFYAIGNFLGDKETGFITQPAGRLVEGAGVLGALSVLGAVANYQMEVWAQPLGEVRRSVQGQWDDLEHQSEINSVVNKTIQDPLCYSEGDCIAVANFEGMVVEMQRNRISFQKIAHLQDEEGDTIQVVHPYGLTPVKVFITNLTRTFKKPDSANGDGGFFDQIEGWVVG